MSPVLFLTRLQLRKLGSTHPRELCAPAANGLVRNAVKAVDQGDTRPRVDFFQHFDDRIVGVGFALLIASRKMSGHESLTLHGGHSKGNKPLAPVI